MALLPWRLGFFFPRAGDDGGALVSPFPSLCSSLGLGILWEFFRII
jgi:hypothetical protein